MSTESPHVILETNFKTSRLFKYEDRDIIGRAIRILCGPRSDVNLLCQGILSSKLHLSSTMQLIIYTSDMQTERVFVRINPIEEISACRVNVFISEAITSAEATPACSVAYAVLSYHAPFRIISTNTAFAVTFCSHGVQTMEQLPIGAITGPLTSTEDLSRILQSAAEGHPAEGVFHLRTALSPHEPFHLRCVPVADRENGPIEHISVALIPSSVKAKNLQPQSTVIGSGILPCQIDSRLETHYASSQKSYFSSSGQRARSPEKTPCPPLDDATDLVRKRAILAAVSSSEVSFCSPLSGAARPKLTAATAEQPSGGSEYFNSLNRRCSSEVSIQPARTGPEAQMRAERFAPPPNAGTVGFGGSHSTHNGCSAAAVRGAASEYLGSAVASGSAGTGCVAYPDTAAVGRQAPAIRDAERRPPTLAQGSSAAAAYLAEDPMRRRKAGCGRTAGPPDSDVAGGPWHAAPIGRADGAGMDVAYVRRLRRKFAGADARAAARRGASPPSSLPPPS